MFTSPLNRFLTPEYITPHNDIRPHVLDNYLLNLPQLEEATVMATTNTTTTVHGSRQVENGTALKWLEALNSTKTNHKMNVQHASTEISRGCKIYFVDTVHGSACCLDKL
ncbi:unnamed protein product [Ceratitis capitata]|uniref:(Mediterranean fruit fly) hypothetical protein n=1 Tax=Ceratitis capitata TaxID=7213 RepID=A0A811V2G2_CERCA|nr:unnamed protein product [Ceratitis capitata]